MKIFKSLILSILIGVIVSTSFTSCVPPKVIQPSTDSVNAYWRGYWEAYYLNADYSEILEEYQQDFNDSLFYLAQKHNRELTSLQLEIDSLKTLPTPTEQMREALIDSLEKVYNSKLLVANQLANDYWKNYYELLFKDSAKIIDTVYITSPPDTITVPTYITIYDTLIQKDTVIITTPPIIIKDTTFIPTVDTLWKTKTDTVYVPKIITVIDTLWRTVKDTTYIEKIDTVYLSAEPTTPQGDYSLKFAQSDIEMDSVRMILAPVYTNKAITVENNYLYKKSGEMIDQYNFITDSLLIYQIGRPISQPVELFAIGTTESEVFTDNNGVSYPGSNTIDGITSEPCYGDVNQPGCDRSSRYIYSGYPHWIEYTFENTYYFTRIDLDVYYSEKDYVHGIKLFADGVAIDSFMTNPTSDGNIWSRHDIGFNAKRIRMEIYDLGDDLPVGLKQNGWTDIWEVKFFGVNPIYLTQLPIANAVSSKNSASLSNLWDGVYLSNKPDSLPGGNFYWAEDTLPKWTVLELDKIHDVRQIDISFFRWDEERQYVYNLQTSIDGLIWEDVVREKQSDFTEWNIHKFDPRPAKFIKLTGISQNQNQWLTVWEIRAFK
jgi:hypothetical protein